MPRRPAAGTAFLSCMGLRTIEILRGATSVALFAVFGLGSLLVSPLMLVLRRIERCQPIVRAVWILLLWLFECVWLIRVDRGNVGRYRGTVIVANHPTLIDVVMLSVLIPRTIYVAKHALRGNPFMAAIVRATSLPDDARLCEAARPYLERGWNVLLFPEGTRSPAEGLHPFHRGAAQLALRTSAPVVCVGERLSRRLLAKRQPAWDMGRKRVDIVFRADMPSSEGVRAGESLHAAARRVTAALEARVRDCLKEVDS